MPTPQYASLDFLNASRLLNLPNALQDQEAATLAQLKSAIEGLAWKDDVRCAASANVNLASPGASIGGVSMAANDRFLARSQTSQIESGIYIWNGAAVAATRAADMNASAEFNAAVVPVLEGTDAGTQWRQTTLNPTVGTSNIVFASFSSSAPAASETTSGIAEIATQAETDAGTDDLRIVTPLKLATWSGRLRRASGNVGDASGTQFDVTHNFNTYDVQITTFMASGQRDNIGVSVRRLDLNTVRLNFDVVPALNAVRVIVWG